jgi:glycosyltransferase involved in cell wall biosynthesis
MGKISLIKKVPHVLVGQFPNASELVGKYSESNVTSFLIGIDSEVWRIIPKNEARAKLSISTNEFVVLSTSRLVPLKQIDKLIIALSRIKNVNFKLFISGHGTREYEKYLHDLVRQYSMQDKVVFIGYVSEEELVTYYCASDLFVNVSLRDGGPMTAWKALALEVPVFNSNSGEVYYFLMKHNSGVIVSPKNYAEWERKLHAIISGSLRINRISRDTVLAELNWESNMKKIASAFQEIIEKYKAKKKR